MEEGKDYYIINSGNVEYRVLTESYLAKRGWCCSNHCTHCPYFPQYQKGNTNLREDLKENFSKNI